MIEKKRCAGVVFENGGKFFLQLRENKAGVNNPGRWGIFGGYLEYGETPEQAVIREMKEELDLTITEDDLVFVTEIDHEGLIRHIFKSPYIIDMSSVVLQEGENMGFFTFDEIMRSENMIPLLKPLLQNHFR